MLSSKYKSEGRWRIPRIQTQKCSCYDAHKPRGKELTEEQKRRNEEIYSFRVNIGRIKIFKTTSEK